MRLAHAHAALVGLVQVAYALVLPRAPRAADRLTSGALLIGLLFLPLGFLLGGLGAREGDPGAMIALSPAGAVALGVGIFRTARLL